MTTDLDNIFGSALPPAAPVELPGPGIYYNVPSEEYHRWPYVGSSLLKAYAKLPSTAREPFESGDDANVGTGIHSFSLQGQAGLDTECFILPAECEGKSVLALKARQCMCDINPGKVPLPPVYGPRKVPMMEVLEGVDNSLNNHPKAGPVIRDSQKEVSVVWIDEGTGLTCKCRFDIWDGSIIWDLKKTKSIASFQWQIKDLGYHLQAGHYMNGALACGLPAVAFGFIPCEAFPPYQIECGYVEPEKLEAAQAEARRIIGLVKESQLTGNWPNWKIPAHCFTLDDIQPDDLVQIY